ncbi:MAG: relaxase domain-containing protein [Roseococcus sp.]|uniref:MobF family relaxase n=1 Tax=Methylobacterium sp. TaxID=409 RepID=UPI001DB28062|nr:MobF family relaxase [Methylobacterium sp.]MBX9752001.1 relaxase domain-containing protein [Roseococcus sp.]MBX9932590.1 relaxase domain-containing protein [Methylobacterium sp.]
MTASLHRLGAGAEAGLYYTNDSRREARPDRRDDYYAKDGDGVWWSNGQTVVRHGAAIDANSFRDLCAGFHPTTGKPLVRGAGPGHWAGQDLTLTPGKSVSVLWMAGTPEQRAAIEAAHRAAVERALAFVAAEGLVTVRTGAGGVDRHHSSDLIVGRFDHYTTREGDPNIHTHCVFINVAGSPENSGSGRYKSQTHLTIEIEQLYAYQICVGAAYRAALAEDLRQRFGLRYREAGRGQWEVAGPPEALLAAFSKRSEQILDYAGAGATSAQREVAALATRRGKHELPTGAELEVRWHEELAACALDPWDAAHHPEQALAIAAARAAEREPPFDPPEIPGESPVARAASALFRHESVVTRKNLLQGALQLAGVQGLGVGVVEAELADLERDGTLLPLAAAVMVPGASACWTSPGIAACEALMLRAADRPLERGWIAPDAVAMALGQDDRLSAEQAEAVRHAAGPDGVSLLQAGAGTGKTTTAAVLVAAAHNSGMRVIGLAPSWVAADELARSTGIPAQAIARWRHDRARAARPEAELRADAAALDRDTLVLVDEAGMVGSRDLEAILSAARGAGAKVVLIGDRKQLASVAGASGLRAVAEVVGRSAVLGEVRRQTVEWQRAASVVMARGDSEAGLRAYAGQHQVELVAGAEAAQARVIAAWTGQRASYGDDVLIVTRRNADAAALNAQARAVLRAEGQLGPDLITATARDREDRLVPLALALGDHLRFGESLPHLGLRNGTRARVEALVAGADDDPRLRLALEDGRVIEAAWDELRRVARFGRRPAHPKVVHAYAGTAYAAQGRTCSAAVVYLGSGTDAREVYVGLTRHRHEARVVVERDRLDALCRQRQADPRMPASDTMVLERLFREARGYREKANVVDYAADRIAFVRDGVLGPPERITPGVDVGRAVRAARTLREAAAWLGVTGLIVPAWRLVDASGRRLNRAPTSTIRRLVAQLARHLGRPDPERGREHGIER